MNLNSSIFPIHSDADAEDFAAMDSNANAAFAKIMNSDSDYDSQKLTMHPITDTDSSSDSPSMSGTTSFTYNMETSALKLLSSP